jgi:YHS domain-containing protein
MKLKVALIIIAVIVIGFFWFRPVNKQNVQMNNQACPVSGDPVNKEHTYVHEGKEYNLCSEECKQPLSENPEKYLSE